MSENSTRNNQNETGLFFEKPILTKKETAKLLNVNLSTLWNWHQRGILKPFGIGGRVYYRRSDIDKALIQL